MRRRVRDEAGTDLRKVRSPVNLEPMSAKAKWISVRSEYGLAVADESWTPAAAITLSVVQAVACGGAATARTTPCSRPPPGIPSATGEESAVLESLPRGPVRGGAARRRQAYFSATSIAVRAHSLMRSGRPCSVSTSRSTTW